MQNKSSLWVQERYEVQFLLIYFIYCEAQVVDASNVRHILLA